MAGRGWCRRTEKGVASSTTRENKRRPDREKRDGHNGESRRARRYFDFHLDTTRSGTSSETAVLIKAVVVLRRPPSVSLFRYSNQ